MKPSTVRPGQRNGPVGVAPFTSDTAQKMGAPERTICRDVTRAKALGPAPERRWTKAPNCRRASDKVHPSL
jgi:hypothetical protein